MEELIKSILKTEADAQQIIADAKKREAGFEDDCHRKQEQLRCELNEKCQKRIELMEDDERKQLDEKLLQIKREADGKMKELSALFEQNKRQWTQTLVNNILGGD